MEFVRIETGKERYMPLLLVGDEQQNMVEKYLAPGALHVLEDGGQTACVAVVLPLDNDTCELKNLAVEPRLQGRGYGSAMLAHLRAQYAGHFGTMLVGTGEVPRTLRFYERAGFVRAGRVPGFFTQHYDHPMFEEGVQLVDMVYLRLPL